MRLSLRREALLAPLLPMRRAWACRCHNVGVGVRRTGPLGSCPLNDLCVRARVRVCACACVYVRLFFLCVCITTRAVAHVDLHASWILMHICNVVVHLTKISRTILHADLTWPPLCCVATPHPGLRRHSGGGGAGRMLQGSCRVAAKACGCTACWERETNTGVTTGRGSG